MVRDHPNLPRPRPTPPDLSQHFRFRQTANGLLVLQIQRYGGGWRDATISDVTSGQVTTESGDEPA